jgi:hypothetical protein
MTESEDRLDLLIEQAKPCGLVSAAAAVLAIHGLLVLTAGVQALVVLTTDGWYAWFPPALVAVGGLTCLAAYGMGRFVPLVGLAGPPMAALAALLSGGWVLVCALKLVILPFALIAGSVAPLSLLLSLVALPAWFRCSSARRQLRIELAEDAPRQAGLGGLVAAGAVVLLLGGGAWALIGGMAAGDPMAVAIVRRGAIHEDADARVAAHLASRLGAQGLFATAVPTSLPAEATLDEVRAAGRSEGALHLLVLDMQGVAEREGVLAGTSLWAVTVSAALTSTRHGDEEIVVADPMEFAYEDPTARAVVDRVGETWVDVLWPWTLDALYARESFQPVLEARVPTTRISAANDLMQLRHAVQARRDREQEWTDWCSSQAEDVAALTAAESGVTCYGDPCRPWNLVGATADGHALVQEGPRVPIFQIPPAPKPSWLEPPERLFVLDPDGPADGRELLRTGNIYGLSEVDRSGRYASVELFGADGAEAIVTMDVRSGEPVDAVVLARRQRTDAVRPSPEGRPLFVRLDGGGTGLLASDVAVDLPNLGDGFWVQTPDGLRVFGLANSEAALYDLEGHSTGRLPVEGWTTVESDGEVLYVMDRSGNGCRMREVDPSTLRVRRTTPIETCLGRPRRMADGRWLGVARLSAPGDAPGDKELVLWDPSVDALLPLTANTFDEEKVAPTPDGRYAWVHRRLEDWPRKFDVRLYRRQLCRVEIP